MGAVRGRVAPSQRTAVDARARGAETLSGFLGRRVAMQFMTKWRTVSSDDVRSMTFETELGAENWAFARLRDGCDDVHIEDDSGKVVVGKVDVFPHRAIVATMSPRARKWGH
jgi:hypothetical protein